MKRLEASGIHWLMLQPRVNGCAAVDSGSLDVINEKTIAKANCLSTQRLLALLSNYELVAKSEPQEATGYVYHVLRRRGADASLADGDEAGREPERLVHPGEEASWE